LPRPYSAPSAARAGLVAPAGLNPGDPYRIIFVTSASISGIQTPAGNSAVVAYNNFVTSAANAGGSELASLATTWSSVTTEATFNTGSYTNAYDNIGGAFSIPVYTPAGVLVAADSTQLWGGGSMDTPIDINEFGNLENTLVWTGSTPAGINQGNPLNYPNIRGGAVFGKSTATDSSWISLGGGNPNGFLPICGISGTLAAPVPEPTTFVLAGMGLVVLGFAALRKKHRRP
jgi:PEP-CTERM motif-containing protein